MNHITKNALTINLVGALFFNDNSMTNINDSICRFERKNIMNNNKTQEKILLSLNVISLMSNRLNELNMSMAFLNHQTAPHIVNEFQRTKEDFHSEIAKDLHSVAEKLGDFLNGWDMNDEDMIEVTSPIFDILNRKIDIDNIRDNG